MHFAHNIFINLIYEYLELDNVKQRNDDSVLAQNDIESVLMYSMNRQKY